MKKILFTATFIFCLSMNIGFWTANSIRSPNIIAYADETKESEEKSDTGSSDDNSNLGVLNPEGTLGASEWKGGYDSTDTMNMKLGSGLVAFFNWITALGCIIGGFGTYKLVMAMLDDRPDAKMMAAGMIGIAAVLVCLKWIVQGLGLITIG